MGAARYEQREGAGRMGVAALRAA